MKVSHVVANFISEIGTKVVFGVSGGASLHLLDAVRANNSTNLVCLHHEQSVAMAAEAHSRLSGEIGVGIVTSGPGATNLITGIAGAFYDSIPCIFISGQVSVNRSKGNTGVRQRGFQETPIIEMVREITKLAISVTDPDEVITALKDAYIAAVTGRKGPVLIDIPDDIQRMDIDFPSMAFRDLSPLIIKAPSDDYVTAFQMLLENSERPVLILGSGLTYSSKRETVIDLLQQSSMPIATTWGAKEMVEASNQALLGTFGTHGSRLANKVINESDLIISIGSRLDLKATGSPVSSFAPHAKKVMFDIDEAELGKFVGTGMTIDLPIAIDLNSDSFLLYLDLISQDKTNRTEWNAKIKQIKADTFPEKRNFTSDGLNPYKFIEKLSSYASNNLDLIVDTGCAIAWTMQEWQVKKGQRIFHDFNNTAMGWSIPATIAGTHSISNREIYCIVGDGSIMMTLGDLANVRIMGKKTVIFLLNNGGYAMIKQTQDQWFSGNYFASNAAEDLAFPDFSMLASSFDISYKLVESENDLVNLFSSLSQENGVVFCEIRIQNDARVIPIVKFGSPNHLMDPEQTIN
jgi:acetolactate synthase-1/2/3 large subunit